MGFKLLPDELLEFLYENLIRLLDFFKNDVLKIEHLPTSDRIDLDSSDYIATSKAVHLLNTKISSSGNDLSKLVAKNASDIRELQNRLNSEITNLQESIEDIQDNLDKRVEELERDVDTTIKNLIVKGTVMLFAQSAAPTGWTKQTSVNNAAVRIVSGTTGGNTTGSVDFSTMFSSTFALPLSGQVGATTLTVSQMPSHCHGTYAGNWTGDSRPYVQGAGSQQHNINTKYAGGGGAHTHTMDGNFTVNLAVKYVDIILCKKN